MSYINKQNNNNNKSMHGWKVQFFIKTLYSEINSLNTRLKDIIFLQEHSISVTCKRTVYTLFLSFQNRYGRSDQKFIWGRHKNPQFLRDEKKFHPFLPMEWLNWTSVDRFYLFSKAPIFLKHNFKNMAYHLWTILPLDPKLFVNF